MTCRDEMRVLRGMWMSREMGCEMLGESCRSCKSREREMRAGELGERA